ncbi:hypothetical protein BDR07DRAFT_1463083 [Suillus spraguei]|nr:hypothetical protein BDR07DRAFT_1463083 [Suillus spraguei]
MDASDEPTPQVVKNSETTRHSKSSRPDPYTTLPAKTTSYIQLRFQLMNFKNVIASFNSRPRSPSPIYTHSSSTCSAGATRTCIAQRLFPTVRGVLGGEEEDFGNRISWKFERDDNPIYHVDSYGVRPEGFGEDYAKAIKDSKLKLGEIWTRDFTNNASLGESPNDEIGIIYEYDFGDTWTVHISCDPKELFFDSRVPMNVPVVKQAQGAPPIEHAPEFVPGEDDPDDKTVSDRIFVRENFELYCQGKLMSCARRTELAIYTPEEEAERQKRLQHQREHRMEVDSDEENYDDDDDDDSGEWY